MRITRKGSSVSPWSRQCLLSLARAPFSLYAILFIISSILLASCYYAPKITSHLENFASPLRSSSQAPPPLPEPESKESLLLKSKLAFAYKKIFVILISNGNRQEFPLLGYGGIEAYVEAVAKELHSLGIQFAVISPKMAQPPSTDPDDPTFVFNEMKILRTPFDGGRPANLFMQEAQPIIRKLIADNGDHVQYVIWSQSNWSGQNLASMNIPMIVSHHDSGDGRGINVKRSDHIANRWLSSSQMREWGRLKPWMTEQLEQQGYLQYSAQLEKYKQTKEEVKWHDSFYQWYGVPGSEYVFYPRKIPKTLLFVGSLGSHKGVVQFLELADMNPDRSFLMYGPGGLPTLQVELKNKNAMMDIPSNVQMLGELKRGKQHDEVFGNASRFFMYVQGAEAFGRTVIEAMSKGTPVLGSTHGSVPELIRGPKTMDNNDINSMNGVVGTISHDMTELNASLHKDYDYKKIFDYAKETFSAQIEIDAMLIKSLELIEMIRKVKGLEPFFNEHANTTTTVESE